MKRVLVFLAATLLICGLTFAASQQSTTDHQSSSGQSTGNSNSNSMSKDTTSGNKFSGIVEKIDQKNQTITIRPESASSSAGTTGSAGTSTASKVKTFKYNDKTNFKSSGSAENTGTIDDLAVGDAVAIQFDSQNNIVSIEETAAAPQTQQ